jgi:hypothetical protein
MQQSSRKLAAMLKPWLHCRCNCSAFLARHSPDEFYRVNCTHFDQQQVVIKVQSRSHVSNHRNHTCQLNGRERCCASRTITGAVCSTIPPSCQLHVCRKVDPRAVSAVHASASAILPYIHSRRSEDSGAMLWHSEGTNHFAFEVTM